jgi:hypothetical protein
LCLCVAGAIICALVSGCARHRPPRTDYGIPRCAPGAGDDLLAVAALQCWFDAAHGRWRIIEHHSLYQELVVDVEATSLGDADDIARRCVTSAGAAFSEMLIYVRPESPRPAPRVRRVRWTRAHGFESIEFPGDAQ